MKIKKVENKLIVNNTTSPKNKNWINPALTFLFFTGLTLTIFEINIFHLTIIDWRIPTGVWLGVGIFALIFFRKVLREYYDTKNIFLQLVFTVCSFGGLSTYGFMASNYYMNASIETETLKTEIIKNGHLAKGRSGCGEPYANVIINGAEKQLIFPCDFEIERYRYVNIKLRRGFLGFYLILEQVPTNQ